MKNLTKPLAILVPSLFLLAAVGTLYSDDKGADKTDSAKPESDTKEGKSAKGRLPGPYGKLDLSGEQKDQIYAIQKKYEAEIDELEAKLKALHDRQETEIQGVLTDAQKSKLAELVAAGKERKKEKDKDKRKKLELKLKDTEKKEPEKSEKVEEGAKK